MNEHLINVLEWVAGIIASLIVVYISHIINSYVFIPRKELLDIIRRLCFTIEFYANRIANPSLANTYSNAGNDLRSVAMELKAFLAVHPKSKYRKLTREDLDNIATRTVFLSNSVNLEKALDANINQLDIIRKELQIGKKIDRWENA